MKYGAWLKIHLHSPERRELWGSVLERSSVQWSHPMSPFRCPALVQTSCRREPTSMPDTCGNTDGRTLPSRHSQLHWEWGDARLEWTASFGHPIRLNFHGSIRWHLGDSNAVDGWAMCVVPLLVVVLFRLCLGEGKYLWPFSFFYCAAIVISSAFLRHELSLFIVKNEYAKCKVNRCRSR